MFGRNGGIGTKLMSIPLKFIMFIIIIVVVILLLVKFGLGGMKTFFLRKAASVTKVVKRKGSSRGGVTVK